jgi:hypothetical protein
MQNFSPLSLLPPVQSHFLLHPGRTGRDVDHRSVLCCLSMHQISSKSTWWHKKCFPTIWFTAVGLSFCSSFVDFVRGRESGGFVLIPLALAAVYYLALRSYVFPLMDEVWIDGDDLIVRNRGQEERFPITNITDVKSSLWSKSKNIEIVLEPPSRFGISIRFAPPFRLFSFGTHPIAQELADRSGCFNRRGRNEA